MKRLLLCLTLLTQPVLADGDMGGKTVDCYCTGSQGERLELGEMLCLQVDGKMFMAQCQMSLNVPMWRRISDGCLSSSLLQSAQPTVDTGSVNAEI